MASLSDAKTLGGIGSLLVLFTAVPNIGWILGIAGLVMVLVAISNISQVLNDRKIYHDMRNAVLLTVGAIAVGTVTVVGAIYRVMGMGSFVGTKFVLASNVQAGDWVVLVAAVVVGVLAVEGLLVASAVFVRRSYKSVASKLNVKTFETAGLLYLIGAATAIIGIGFLLILIAEILLAVGFFSITEQPREQQLRIVTATS